MSKTAVEMPTQVATQHMVEFREAMELLKNEYPEKALPKFREVHNADRRNPYYISFLGLSLARAEQKWDEASELCEHAIRINRKEIQFHLNLTEVYLLAGQRDKAMHVLEHASRLFGNDARFKRLRSQLKHRRVPILAFLTRDHFLNRELGKLRHRMLSKQDKP